ncbi:MAG TPA: PIN domain-containing protein [Methylomirabilota bacterium]|nr:PIN domain-containing protein [Methylomirabilota bacterium]
MSKPCLLDTNVLVRFFTGQPPDMARRARTLIAQADTGKLLLQIPSLIVAETLYTLESFYEMPRADVCDKMLAFLRSRGIAPLEPEIITDALERYHSLPVHFADAYLAASAAASGTPVFSFDEDFARFKDITWKH